MDDLSRLTQLGSKATEYRLDAVDAGLLECFDNPYEARDYLIRFETDEFTSLCPKTGQPDFGRVNIEYIPDRLCIETKSLKLFLFSFRNTGAFMEEITNAILNSLNLVCKPRYMKVVLTFAPRGGIHTTVEAVHDPNAERALKALGAINATLTKGLS